MSDDKPVLPLYCGRHGCIGPAAEPHPCPFKSEINDDETPCRCCKACTRECADEI